MKMLTIIVSRDLSHEVEDIIAGQHVDCYAQFPDALGISHSCKGMLGDNLPWEASVMLVSGEDDALEALAEAIQAHVASKPFKPCLRMMLSAVDKAWV
ncbi:hypothetical protein LLH00_15235 [bacterium]|nr:hypothetical protein [bacterium]